MSSHEHGQARQQPPLCGRRVVGAGLLIGGAAFAVALFFRTVLATTSVRVSPRSLFWSTILISGFGLVAGMAVEAVRQLQCSNPDPAYHRKRNQG